MLAPPKRFKAKSFKRATLAFVYLFLVTVLVLMAIVTMVRKDREVFSETLDWLETSNLDLATYLDRDLPLLFPLRPLLPNKSFELVFFVISAPGNADRREEIRHTWARRARKFGYPVIFVLGKK